MSLMHTTYTHSNCTSATKDLYIRPLTVLRATKIFSCLQPRTYIYVVHVLCQQLATYKYILIKQIFIDAWLLDVYFFGCSV